MVHPLFLFLEHRAEAEIRAVGDPHHEEIALWTDPMTNLISWLIHYSISLALVEAIMLCLLGL